MDVKQSDKKQHVEFQRKIKLRKGLIERVGKLTGAYYVPFIGEGDIAAALYSDKKIYGADIDPAMVEIAMSRLPTAEIITADCDKYPFKKSIATFSLADFDSYSYPYDSFRSFFKGANIGSQCVLFFTDGQRQAIIRTGHYRTPEGLKIKLKTKTEKRSVYNFYFNKVIVPWFKDYIKPWTILYMTKYLRAGSMCYWGAIIEKPGQEKSDILSLHKEKPDIEKQNKVGKFDRIKKGKYLEHISNGHTRGYAATLTGVSRQTIINHMKKDSTFADAVSEAESDAIGKVEHALHEAAESGNMTAIQVFLYNRDPKRWSDRRNIQLAADVTGTLKVDIDVKGKLISILNRLAIRAREAEGDPKPEPEGS